MGVFPEVSPKRKGPIAAGLAATSPAPKCSMPPPPDPPSPSVLVSIEGYDQPGFVLVGFGVDDDVPGQAAVQPPDDDSIFIRWSYPFSRCCLPVLFYRLGYIVTLFKAMIWSCKFVTAVPVSVPVSTTRSPCPCSNLLPVRLTPCVTTAHAKN